METAKSGKERRKDLRLEILGSLSIRFSIAKKKSILRLYTKKYASARNISAGGILVELPGIRENQMDRIIEGKDRLVLELTAPYFKTPFKIPGKIIWLEKKGMRHKPLYVVGISFEDIKEKDREKLLPLLVGLCLKGKANLEKL